MFDLNVSPQYHEKFGYNGTTAEVWELTNNRRWVKRPSRLSSRTSRSAAPYSAESPPLKRKPISRASTAGSENEITKTKNKNQKKEGNEIEKEYDEINFLNSFTNELNGYEKEKKRKKEIEIGSFSYQTKSSEPPKRKDTPHPMGGDTRYLDPHRNGNTPYPMGGDLPLMWGEDWGYNNEKINQKKKKKKKKKVLCVD
eukprot:Trichotokara_eunicae@DN4741_c0_g1_i1.p1